MMSGFTNSNGIGSDREHLLPQDTEAEGGLHGNGTSINTISLPQTAILAPEKSDIINDNDLGNGIN